MVKKTTFFLMGCVAVGSVVYALAHYDSMMADQALNAQIIEDLEIDRPFVALRPPDIWGRLELIEEAVEPEQPPKFVLAPIVIEVSLSRLLHRHRRRPARRARAAAAVRARSSEGVMARFSAAPAAPEPVAETLLRESLDRETIAAVMRSMRRSVQRCYDTGMVPGQVNLTLSVEGESGRVSRVHVDETSTTARCIQGVASRLRFPRFGREQLTIEYPYDLR